MADLPPGSVQPLVGIIERRDETFPGRRIRHLHQSASPAERFSASSASTAGVTCSGLILGEAGQSGKVKQWIHEYWHSDRDEGIKVKIVAEPCSSRPVECYQGQEFSAHLRFNPRERSGPRPASSAPGPVTSWPRKGRVLALAPERLRLDHPVHVPDRRRTHRRRGPPADARRRYPGRAPAAT